jgi:hypothetical protein
MLIKFIPASRLSYVAKKQLGGDRPVGNDSSKPELEKRMRSYFEGGREVAEPPFVEDLDVLYPRLAVITFT